MRRLYKAVARFPLPGREQEEALLIIPDNWNTPAIIDALASLDLDVEMISDNND